MENALHHESVYQSSLVRFTAGMEKILIKRLKDRAYFLIYI